jgi:uncharacterized membrane protein YedE/YeeE
MEFTIHLQILGIVLVTGIVMGAVANKTNFCTMGAVSDWVNMGDTGRLRAWLLAIAVAMLGVVVLEASGKATIGTGTFPPYRTPNLAWLRYVLGGLMFGVGMTLASGCGNKTLVRIGGGNLKSVVVLAIASACAYAMLWTNFYDTLFGSMMSATTINLGGGRQGQPGAGRPDRSRQSGLRSQSGGCADRLRLFLERFSWQLRPHPGRRRHRPCGGRRLVCHGRHDGRGLEGIRRFRRRQAVAGGNPVLHLHESDGRPGPLRDESGGYLADQFRHRRPGRGDPRFAALFAGSRSFRIEWFVNAGDFLNHAVGAVLMGIGGVLSMGCTIGQGITGVSTLALGSVLTLIAIVAGSAAMMKYQYWRMMQEA